MTSERIKAVGESTPPLSIGFDIAIAMCRRADVLGHPYPSPELRVWLANQITIAVNAARASSPTPDGVIKERGEEGRRPDGPGLSHSVSSPLGSPAAAASIPGAGGLPEQVAAQCRVVSHLARALSRVHDDYALLANAGAFASIMNDVGQRSAELMELLGDTLNNMDASSAEDEWTYPIFEKAQRMFPSRARDQRAEREDAQRPRPEAASPVRSAEAPILGIHRRRLANIDAKWNAHHNLGEDEICFLIRMAEGFLRPVVDVIGKAEAPASIVQPPSSQESGVGEPGRDDWCYDMDLAPRDDTRVLLTVPNQMGGDRDHVGEAQFNPEAYGGTWWWAGESEADYYAEPISAPPIAWRHLPPPATPRPSQREG